MATLNLGVHDISYAAAFPAPAPGKKRTLSAAQRAYGAGKKTGEIAQLLEDKYKVMRTFYEMRRQVTIIPAIERSVQGALINVMLGQPGPIMPTSMAMSRIGEQFKDDLSMRRFDGKIPGVPTLASLRGVSHRFKKPYARRPSRPSFIDTGMYQSSFTVWMDP